MAWSAPASDGGSPITGYTATSSPGAKTCTTTGALSCTVSGLTNGTPYTFTVTATNAAGTGPASAPSAVGHAAGRALGAHRGDRHRRQHPGARGLVGARLRWRQPDHRLHRHELAGGQDVHHERGPSCTVSGLTNGTPYTFTVTATNAAGTGPASAPSARSRRGLLAPPPG